MFSSRGCGHPRQLRCPPQQVGIALGKLESGHPPKKTAFPRGGRQSIAFRFWECRHHVVGGTTTMRYRMMLCGNGSLRKQVKSLVCSTLQSTFCFTLRASSLVTFCLKIRFEQILTRVGVYNAKRPGTLFRA